MLGTAAYLAPEQALGEDVGAAADVYSLGAVLYELLTGEPPFRFESLAQLAAERPPLRPLRELAPEVPPALEDVVMRALARNPAYRPASAAELGAELAAAVHEAPTEGGSSPPGSRRRGGDAGACGRWPIARRPRGAAHDGRRRRGDLAHATAAEADEARNGARPPPRIARVPRGPDAAAQARNLASWIGRYSGAGR